MWEDPTGVPFRTRTCFSLQYVHRSLGAEASRQRNPGKSIDKLLRADEILLATTAHAAASVVGDRRHMTEALASIELQGLSACASL